MDDEPLPSPEPSICSGPADLDPPRPRIGPTLQGSEADALAAEADEIRRLVDAGAGSPEELRVLAERMRAHRAREEALWRAQVKPTLRAKRGLPVGRPVDAAGTPRAPSAPRQTLLLGLGLLGAVIVVVLLAASSSIVWVLLPVVGVLAVAWWQGKQEQ
jgi:hypothetical protein